MLRSCVSPHRGSGRQEVRVALVEATALEGDRVHERGPRQLCERRRPVSELGEPLPEVGLDQRRPRERVQARAELVGERRVVVDAVVVAVGEERVLDRAADTDPDDRARPALPVLDPGLEHVRHTERGVRARRRRRVPHEAEIHRRDGARRGVDRIEGEVARTEVGGEKVGEHPARGIRLDVSVRAREEALAKPDAGQERRRVAGVDAIRVAEQVSREQHRGERVLDVARQRDPEIEGRRSCHDRHRGVDPRRRICAVVRERQCLRHLRPAIREAAVGARPVSTAVRDDARCLLRAPHAAVLPAQHVDAVSPVEEVDHLPVRLAQRQPIAGRREDEGGRIRGVDPDRRQRLALRLGLRLAPRSRRPTRPRRAGTRLRSPFPASPASLERPPHWSARVAG